MGRDLDYRPLLRGKVNFGSGLGSAFFLVKTELGQSWMRLIKRGNLALVTIDGLDDMHSEGTPIPYCQMLVGYHDSSPTFLILTIPKIILSNEKRYQRDSRPDPG